jgi:hypothetical protein
MPCKLFLSFGLLALSSTTGAATALHINIQAIDGTAQTVAINQQLPQRFIAGATFDDGSPVAGLDLQFGVNVCMSPLGAPGTQSACPDAATYGHFLGSSITTTDALGRAISAPFVAGSAQGSYNVFVSPANWTQLINGQTVTDIPASPSVSNLFRIVQAPPAVDPAPSLSAPALIALVTLVALLARRRIET